jgi:uncharacterized membrane protein HdeD (DUF308 family)
MATTYPQVPAHLGVGAMALHALVKNWWLLLLRGVASILFGVLALAWPGLTLLVLVVLFGAYALADGILALAAAISGTNGPGSRWWLAVVGFLGIGMGILTMLFPGITGVALLVFIALWAMSVGVFEIVGAIQLRKELDDFWLLIASGALSFLFGLLLLVQPGTGALALAWMIGLYAIALGVVSVTLALRLRKHREAMPAS